MIACDCSPTVIPLALKSILLHFIMRAQEGSVTTSHLHFDLHTRPCSHTQRDKVGSQLTCRHTKKANFCLAVTGNSSLGSRSGVGGGGGGEKILHCMGMGLKENTAQTPDVETPCTHTSTHTNKCKHTQWHTYKNKQMGKGGGNEGHKPALGAPLGVFWLVARAHFLSLLAVPKMSKHKMSRRANETVCVSMSVNESEWDTLNVREKAV